MVELGAFNYYKFTLLMEDSSISKVRFEISSLIGEVSMFSSQTEEQPSVNRKDRQSFWNSIVYSRGEFRPQNSQMMMSGTFFVAVQGDASLSRYTIRVSIQREDELQVSWLRLVNDVP